MHLSLARQNRFVWLERCLACLFMLGLSFAAAHMISGYEMATDYCGHLKFARYSLVLGILPLPPHFLYQLIVATLYSVFPFISSHVAGIYLVPIGAQVLLAFVICYVFDQLLGFPRSLAETMRRLFFICTLLFIGPIVLFTLPRMFLGYIHPHVYSSANIHLSKVFSVLLFFFTLDTLQEKPSNTSTSLGPNTSSNFTYRQRGLLLLALTVLSFLAKPSYMICFLPGVLLTVVYVLIREKVDNPKISYKSLLAIPFVRLMFWCVFLPSLFILGWQYMQFVSASNAWGRTNSFVFSPGGVFAYYMNHDYLAMFFLFVLSVLFPVLFCAFYYQNCIRNFRLSMAWIIFLISCFCVYFFSESIGEYGNFLWGAQIALLILFIESTVAFIQYQKSQNVWNSIALNKFWQPPVIKKYVCFAVYSLHVLSGLLFYSQLFFPFYFMPSELVKYIGVECPY